MEKILVYDVAAQNGGAETILEKYYLKLAEDTEHEYFFALGLLSFPEKENVHMVRMPWVKKSWLHRLYCDYIYMPRLIKKLGISRILSLQNIGIPGCKLPQTVYVHNAIPFTEHRFSFKSERFLWVYQNIIGRLTYRSLKKAHKIIVQTRWMKDAVIAKCGVLQEQVEVERVDSAVLGQGQYAPTSPVTFFYPAAPVAFKNHRVIVEACQLLKQRGICNYRVLFTVSENENNLSLLLSAQAREEGLPISFIGKQSHDQMIAHYREAVLLFPSYLETVGLPLLEAQQFGAPMIAADCSYARETVGDYKMVSFFSPLKSYELAGQMERWIR